jgi:putative transcriptional regulator
MSFLAGTFLVARPVLQDPTFKQTVILLLQHSREGACGLVVNRPAQAKGLPFPVYVGGPCPSPGLFMVHGHAEWVASEDVDAGADAAEQQLAPGIFIGDAASLDRASKTPPAEDLRFRVFRGYAGWGPDQLERELAAGAWAVAAASSQLLFDTPVEELWSLLAPPTIPQPSLN